MFLLLQRSLDLHCNQESGFSREFLRACAPTRLPCRGIGQLGLYKPARTANVIEYLESLNQAVLIAKFPKDPTYPRDHIVGSYINQKDKFVYSVVIIGPYHSLGRSIPHIKITRYWEMLNIALYRSTVQWRELRMSMSVSRHSGRARRCIDSR